MSTQPIEHTGYGYSFKQTRKAQEDVDFPLGPELSKKRQEIPAEPRTTVRDHIRTLLEDVPKQDGSRLSFNDIADYRDSLKQDWDAVVTSELSGLGVDLGQKFGLMLDPTTDRVTVSDDHPDAMKIDQYFESNPEMGHDFETVLQLGKLVDVAERKLSPQQMDQTLETEAMAWWYQSNMDTATLFTGGGVVFGMGSSAYKGVDIHV